MSFINFNKREDHSADYSVKMVKEALLAIESKNINKVNSLLEGFTDNLRLDEALNLFSNKLNAINALDAAKLNNIEQVIEANSNLIKIKVKGKQIKVDINTIEVDGIDTRDYPDFVDAFFSYAEDHKGKELSDDELDVLTDENPDLINELIFDQQLYAGLIIAEGKSINKIQKEWAEVTADMASTVKVWKTAEGETKTQLLEKLRALNLRKKELEQELDVAVMGKDRNTELSGAFESNMAVNEWGSSDQSIFLDSMHKDAGKPKKMPSPFDDKLRQAAEDAVDFYWDEWPEYKKDRNALVDDAVRSYLRKYFKNDFEMLTRMFEKEDNGSVITEASFDSEELYNEIKKDRKTEMISDIEDGSILFYHKDIAKGKAEVNVDGWSGDITIEVPGGPYGSGEWYGVQVSNMKDIDKQIKSYIKAEKSGEFENMEESVVTEAKSKFKIGDRVSILSKSSKKPFDSGEVTGIQKDGTILINGLETISHEVAIDAELVVKESVVTEAKKYKFKELAKAWEFVYGEEMEDEYEGFYQEVVGKYKNKVTKEDIAEIWNKVYGEDIATEYDGFFGSIKENLNTALKLDKLFEANADGTISDDEDDAVENMLVDVEYMVDELVNYIKVETKKIGGSFRSPGMEAQCLKLVKETFKKHKVRL